MYQAGLRDITLYENKGITFYYFDPLDLNNISNLENTGEVIEIENNQQPDMEPDYSLGSQGEVLTELMIKFRLLGYQNENIIYRLKNSIYGWCPLITFYDGTVKFYNMPLFCRQSNIRPQREMSFEIELNTAAPSKSRYFDYTPGISTVPVYRWDTELLTWDNDLYTFDYEL